MKTKNDEEATLGLLRTLIRFGVMSRPNDFPLFMVWYKDVKRYSTKYGISNKIERA